MFIQIITVLYIYTTIKQKAILYPLSEVNKHLFDNTSKAVLRISNGLNTELGENKFANGFFSARYDVMNLTRS